MNLLFLSLQVRGDGKVSAGLFAGFTYTSVVNTVCSGATPLTSADSGTLFVAGTACAFTLPSAASASGARYACAH